MSATDLSLHYHVVFSTKDLVPLIAPAWRVRLHEYLGGEIRGLGAVPEIVGGVADHVLVGLKATHCLSDFMRDLKKGATVWVRSVLNVRDFSWQEVYAAFTVSPTSRPAVKNDIAHQESHHRQKSFREELIALLQGAGVEYDERYLVLKILASLTGCIWRSPSVRWCRFAQPPANFCDPSGVVSTPAPHSSISSSPKGLP